MQLASSEEQLFREGDAMAKGLEELKAIRERLKNAHLAPMFPFLFLLIAFTTSYFFYLSFSILLYFLSLLFTSIHLSLYFLPFPYPNFPPFTPFLPRLWFFPLCIF